MQIKTVHNRIISLIVVSVATPLVALLLREGLDENVGKYASLWFVVVGVPVIGALGSLTRSALIEYERTPDDAKDSAHAKAVEEASKAVTVAEDKVRVLESQNERLQDKAVSLEAKIRDMEEEAAAKEKAPPTGIIDGLRSVIDHAGDRVMTTLTGGTQLEVGLSLSKEEVAGVQSMLDALGRKLARPQVEEIIEAQAGDNSRRLLLVEDDLTSRRLIRALLPKDLKVNITEAEDGQIALQMMEKPPYPDVIVCDVLMPNMDGLEFLARIRDLPRFSNTPVVMISANAFKDNVAKAASLKVTKFLRKPLDRQELNDAIEAALKSVGSKDSAMFKAQQRLCLDDKAYFELSAGFSRAISESITFVRSSISRDRWQAAAIRVNALGGSIQMVGDERLSSAITRVESQLKRANVTGVTVELEVLEQENERFMRTLVHAFNDENPVDSETQPVEQKPSVSVSVPD
jgi:two-component system chemotaxis response regulator CheY